MPEQVLAEADLQKDFTPGADPRGDPATLELDSPLALTEGQTYFLRFEVDNGQLTLSG